MKAIRVRAFGGPEVLKIEDVPTPRPAAGQVLIRVRATGVNPYDTYMRNGTYAIKPPLPYTPGSDAAARPVDQHDLAAAGVGVMAKRVVRSAVRDPEPGALRKRGPVRQRVDL